MNAPHKMFCDMTPREQAARIKKIDFSRGVDLSVRLRVYEGIRAAVAVIDRMPRRGRDFISLPVRYPDLGADQTDYRMRVQRLMRDKFFHVARRMHEIGKSGRGRGRGRGKQGGLL